MFETIAQLLNFIFWPFLTLPPILSIFFLALIATVLIIVINMILIKKDVVNELKERMNVLREELIELQKQGNMEKAKEVINEITKHNLSYMKLTLKAMLVSMVAITLILPWAQYTYKDMPVAKLPLALPYFGSNLNWFIWYFVASLTIGWILRKLMGWDYG
ncbi:MAG: EMC3/TMCO1 family protein [Candidatus Aenigmatarchaeota archaeon]